MGKHTIWAIQNSIKQKLLFLVLLSITNYEGMIKILILKQSEARGVQDPERLKRQQKRKENREKEALKQGPSDGGLKVIRISFII